MLKKVNVSLLKSLRKVYIRHEYYVFLKYCFQNYIFLNYYMFVSLRSSIFLPRAPLASSPSGPFKTIQLWLSLFCFWLEPNHSYDLNISIRMTSHCVDITDHPPVCPPVLLSNKITL